MNRKYEKEFLFVGNQLNMIHIYLYFMPKGYSEDPFMAFYIFVWFTLYFILFIYKYKV